MSSYSMDQQGRGEYIKAVLLQDLARGSIIKVVAGRGINVVYRGNIVTISLSGTPTGNAVEPPRWMPYIGP